MGIPMDEFGPVSLDYFAGHLVEEVISDKDELLLMAENAEEGAGTEQPMWVIKFSSGSEIWQFSPNIPPPPNDIVGKTQTLVTLEAGVTRVFFGTKDAPRAISMRLDPMQYAIVDENYTQGHVVYAQRSRANMPPTVETPDAEPEDIEDDGA